MHTHGAWKACKPRATARGLTPVQSKRRIACLRKEGYHVRVVRLSDGATVVFRSHEARRDHWIAIPESTRRGKRKRRR